MVEFLTQEEVNKLLEQATSLFLNQQVQFNEIHEKVDDARASVEEDMHETLP